MRLRLRAGMIRTFTGILCILLVAGCASAPQYLKWKQLDIGAFMRSEAGRQAYNTIRFETYGPKAQQLFAYFLYKDGIEVEMGGGIPMKKLGKKTLMDAMNDYSGVERSNMYSAGSALVVREVYRGGDVVGYTAADMNVDVSVWDITKGEGPPVLRVVYKDLRDREGDEMMRHPMRRPF